MSEDSKKIWYVAHNFNFWRPVSWEGWLHMAVALGVISSWTYFIPKDAPFSLTAHWPHFAGLLVYVIVMQLACRGHVEKRY